MNVAMTNRARNQEVVKAEEFCGDKEKPDIDAATPPTKK